MLFAFSCPECHGDVMAPLSMFTDYQAARSVSWHFGSWFFLTISTSRFLFRKGEVVSHKQTPHLAVETSFFLHHRTRYHRTRLLMHVFQGNL
jgi:predicted transporter